MLWHQVAVKLALRMQHLFHPREVEVERGSDLWGYIAVCPIELNRISAQTHIALKEQAGPF